MASHASLQLIKPYFRGVLEYFTRSQLRAYASQIGVERGQDKHDTIMNLATSGKAYINVTLADPAKPTERPVDTIIQEMGHRVTGIGPVMYIRIFTNDYRQLSWDEVWQTFTDRYQNSWAVQFFPPADKTVNETNMYHLFILEAPIQGISIHPSDW